MSDRQLGEKKILVVDDLEDNLHLLSALLTAKGYEVKAINSGKLAIEAIEAAPPDIILLDVWMPEMDGYEVCKVLKANPLTKDIPIIFISALNKATDKTQAFDVGGDDYITKPFQIEEVVARVEHQLSVRSLQAELKAKNRQLEQEIHHRQVAENELLQLNQKLSVLATLDGLTQVANRHRFDEFLAREWLRARREKFPLSLIMIDVDYFKNYNDRFGHQAGDNCLKQVARAISQVVQRPADLVARYGGEEFAVILPQTPATNALQVAEKIRRQVKKLQLEHPQSSVSNFVSLSLGVTCVVPSPTYTKRQLLVTADKALYAAKQLGRDRAILKLLD